MGAVTRAAEGFDRRAFTVSEVLRMQEAGIISEDENFELIEGEIVPAQARSPVHQTFKSAGADIVLAVEVASTSLAYDREFKAELYARHRFHEYWVVDAINRQTFQFAEPRGKSWRRRDKRGPDEVLTHPALPAFSIRLSDY
jgi:Uma2 family endonuclease